MTNAEFKKILDDVIAHMRATLETKGIEYSSATDRLHNFKTGALFNGNTSAETCWGFMTKHLVSVYDVVHNGAPYDAGVLDEKIGDIINYFTLLKAILTENMPATAPVVRYKSTENDWE